jgi:hypothetical protein
MVEIKTKIKSKMEWKALQAALEHDLAAARGKEEARKILGVLENSLLWFFQKHYIVDKSRIW